MEKTQNLPLHLLRILSGSNSGARTLLKLGEYIVGSSHHCDIILHDTHIASQHVKIIVTEEAMLLYPLVHPVYVDGKEIGKTEYKLKHYQVITIGNVHFAIGSLKKAWPTLKRPNINTPEKDNFLETNKYYPNRYSANKKKSQLNWLHVLLAGVSILVLANFLYFKPDMSSLFSTKTQEKQLSTLSQDLDLPGVQIQTLNNGNIRVNGYVKNEKQKSQLLQQLARLEKPLTHRVWVDDQLVEHANYIANTFDETNIDFSMPEHGILKASGFVNNANNWNKVRQNILSDVDGIANIEDEEVNSLKDQISKLRSYIEDENFADRMSIKLKDGELLINGELTDDEISRWQSLKISFASTYGNLPNMTENLQSPRSRFKLAIKSVSVGKVPFITSKDDKKYMVGSHLGEGYYVKSITPDKIILKHDDLEIPVYFGNNNK